MLRAHRRGSGEELLLLLRHKVRYEELEGLDDAARDVEVARSMRGEAERERATVRRLAGCKAWAPLDHELGAAAVARVGPTGAYPCVVLEAGRGKLLHELLPLDGCGGDADADGGKGGGGLPSPAQLDAHLSVRGSSRSCRSIWRVCLVCSTCVPSVESSKTHAYEKRDHLPVAHARRAGPPGTH